jgi:hypothetical protein
MLISRCAWHRKYHGYPAITGIASWRGRRVQFTDGMCKACAAQLRFEWYGDTESEPGRASSYRRLAWLAPGAGMAAAAALLAMVLAARPLHDPADVLLTRIPAVAVPEAVPVGSGEMAPGLVTRRQPGDVSAQAGRLEGPPSASPLTPTIVPAPPLTAAAPVAPAPKPAVTRQPAVKRPPPVVARAAGDRRALVRARHQEVRPVAWTPPVRATRRDATAAALRTEPPSSPMPTFVAVYAPVARIGDTQTP